MKNAAVISSLIAVAAAQNWGSGNWGPGDHGPPGVYGGIPSCVGDCLYSQGSCSQGDYSCYCNSTSISTFNTCISSGSCSDADKSAAYQAVAQFCANEGKSVTASQEATFSATSGGSAWPTQWTSNSAWNSALSSWKTQTTGAPGPFGAGWANGWSAGDGYGPFGRGGPGNGWGPWASDTTGAWTSGQWTKWWGTNACPPSTWSGWTTGSWSASPSWTSWTACTATTTATSVITTTVSSNGAASVVTSTSFGIKADQAAATTSSGSGAQPTQRALAGAAAVVGGVLAGVAML